MSVSQLERLSQIVERLTYKPRWKFQALTSYEETGKPSSLCCVNIFRPEPDVNFPDKQVTVANGFALAEEHWSAMTDAQIVDRIMGLIIEAEIHEVHEWLKFDGKNVREPHPDEFKGLERVAI